MRAGHPNRVGAFAGSVANRVDGTRRRDAACLIASGHELRAVHGRSARRGSDSRRRGGERPIAAVAVVDEAMVARAHDRVQETNDPTAHAVIVALREAARKLGRHRLAERDDLRDPRAVLDVRRGAAGERRRGARLRRPEHRRRRRRHGPPARPAPGPRRRIQVVSGIRRDEAEALFAAGPHRLTPGLAVAEAVRREAFAILSAERCPSG